MLELEDVHASYGAIIALRSVSISVRQGELVALVGSNGAGKTTTLTTVAGGLRPTKGRIEFEGTSLIGLTPEQVVRLGISMVPENRDVFPTLTVEQNLRLGAFIRKNREEYQEDLAKVCERFPILRKRLHQPGGTLSGGEQQQLVIARALMAHPRLLILDEPSLGLAPALVEEIFRLIRELHEAGTTILLVEQNVRKTLQIADRAYLLNLGRVVASGTPSELQSSVDLESIYLGGGSRTAGGEAL